MRQGALSDPRWVAAFQAVPRELFVPAFLADNRDGTFTPVNATDPEWLERVYADEPLVIEVDGPTPVSSSSQPSLMASMLEALRVTGEERILEIGTGTGYNAALLCEALANCRLVSMDISKGLVEAARERLRLLGHRPTLAVGDGADGYPRAAPYDRIIATCSLPHVPATWLEQVAEGGLIMVHLHRDLGGAALAVLQVHDEEASGTFALSGGFMHTRTLRPVRAVELYEARAGKLGDRRATAIRTEVLKDREFAMFASLLMPGVQQLGLAPGDGPDQDWLVSVDGSWAYRTTDTGMVAQGGPTRLWDRLEELHALWRDLGSPQRSEFGLTVHADGRHVLWHGNQEGPTWDL
jgi:protein-L-isoaspartate(D-aspartate) O-methyltransferase